MIYRRFACILFMFFAAMGSTGSGVVCFAESLNDGVYAELLEKHVTAGVVDYGGFKKEEARLNQYLKVLERVNPGTLSRNDRMAFYINAYNAWTIKLVLSAYPGIKSIKDLGGLLSTPWKKEICRIDGKIISLDHLEHKIIRPEFQDPRVHFALNCASKSCPPLISKPYYGESLDQQLDVSVKAFINNPQRNRLDGNILRVSKIFSWYESDFKDGVVGFFRKYAEGDLKVGLEGEKRGIQLEYFDYDWSLNGR